MTTRPLFALPYCLAALLGAGAGCTVGSNGSPDAGPPVDDAGPEHLLLSIEPAEAVLQSTDGSSPAVSFRLIGENIEGERFELEAERWQVTREELATIAEDGTLTATGRAGGTLEVIAWGRSGGSVQTVRAQATVNVAMRVDAPPALVDRVEGLPEVEAPFEAVTLLYPLDGSRMPNNVGPPDLQWHPIGEPGEVFRIVLQSEHATIESYVEHGGAGFGSHYAVDPLAFRALADSARGAEVTVRVDRVPAGDERVVLGHPVQLFFSEDGLFGTLYYWQVRARPASSEVFRIDAARAERAAVFENETGSCAGCHNLSPDGRQLAATLGGSLGWRTTVVDAAGQQLPLEPLLGPLTPAYHTMAWSPEHDRILASRPLASDRNDTRLFLLDGADGTELDAAGLPEERAGYPAWSPDGSLVAWMQGGGDGPDGTEAQTRIMIADTEAAEAEAFSPRVLHDGGALIDSPEGGQTDSHPTFSPDSRYVVFAHGTSSISTRHTGEPEPRSGLYIIAAGGGEPIRLDEGMGTEGPVDAFWPVFSPFVTQEADGTVHFWLAFYSRQGYGNDAAGTGGTRRRQLWLMAIDPARVERGLDPSYPPYWLPGQDTSAEDIAAMWAPTACRSQGEACASSSECCSGHCDVGGDHGDIPTCQPPLACRGAGQSCETESDCCDGLACNLNVCGYAPPE